MYRVHRANTYTKKSPRKDLFGHRTSCYVNTLRPRQDGRHFPDNTFKCIFLNENVIILIKISLKFVAIGPISNIPSLVQIMARCRPGDKPLTEPMHVRLPTHICVTRPQLVKIYWIYFPQTQFIKCFKQHMDYEFEVTMTNSSMLLPPL